MDYSNKFNNNTKFIKKLGKNLKDLQKESDTQFLLELGLTQETIKAIEDPVTHILNDWNELGL